MLVSRCIWNHVNSSNAQFQYHISVFHISVSVFHWNSLASIQQSHNQRNDMLTLLWYKIIEQALFNISHQIPFKGGCHQMLHTSCCCRNSLLLICVSESDPTKLRKYRHFDQIYIWSKRIKVQIWLYSRNSRNFSGTHRSLINPQTCEASTFESR